MDRQKRRENSAECAEMERRRIEDSVCEEAEMQSALKWIMERSMDKARQGRITGK